jgi:iron complex outermembrane receptor protein
MVVNTERIEVLRGSGSSLYGTNAMGGVLDVRTDQGGGDLHGEISAEGGGLGFFRGVARAGGGLASNRFTYSGGLTHLNVTEGVDSFDPYRNTSGQGFAQYNWTSRARLSGRVFASDAFGASNESPTVEDAVAANHPATGLVPGIGLDRDQLRLYAAGQPFTPGSATFIPAFNDSDNHRASSFLAGAFVWSHELTPTGSYRLSYSGVDTGRSFRDGPAGINEFDPVFSSDSRFDGRIDTFQARTDHYAGEHHLLTAGYEYEHEDFLNVNTDDNPDPAQGINDVVRIRQASHAVFAQDQMRLMDGRLQVSLSGRAQGFRLSRPRFEGAASPYDGAPIESPDVALTADGSAAYFFRGSATKLRAHAGNAYRSPAPFERFGASFFGRFLSVWGDPRLKPERSVGFDAGIDQWLANSRVRLSGTYFYTALQETIVFDFGVIDPAVDPFGRSGGYRNTGGGVARGVELSATAAPLASLQVAAAYTYANSDSRTATDSAGLFFETLGVSRHVFSLTAVQRLGRSWDVSVDLYAAGKYPFTFFSSPRVFALDGPVKADVVASYNRPIGERARLRLYGKIDNLFDNTYWEDGFSAPGIWGIAGLAVSF